MASAHANRRGILAMCGAMTCFIANDTLLKLASAELPAAQIMAIRGLFATSFALALVARAGHLPRLASLLSPRVALRGAIEALVAFLFISSLAVLPLANITAILQAAPLIITLFAVMLGVERIGWRRWAAVSTGFLGVLLVIKPDPAAFNLYAGLALLSAVLVACRDLLTRFIAAEVPTEVVTLSTTATVMAMGFLLGLATPWRPVGLAPLALIAVAASFVTLGNFAIILAMRAGDVSVVAPFRYIIILLSILLGFLVFGEIPDPLAWCGILLVAGSGLYTLHREQRRVAQARVEESRVEEARLAEAKLAESPAARSAVSPP